VITKGLFLPMCLILVLQAAVSRVLTVPERDFPLPGLHQLADQFGNWEAHGEQTLEANVVEYLKPDEYILREYTNKTAGSSIGLYIAYSKSLQKDYGPHSPRICLPGSGWLVRSSKIQEIELPGRAGATPVNEYVLEKADDRILMLYWYQNNRSVWAEEFRAKLTMLPDLIRYRRSDASLVRLITTIRSGDGAEELKQSLGFTKLMFPALVERFQTTN
jgi:EpsI family protein